jgi:malate dehydrogenase (oxaloacetate-decarboxylating)
MNYQQAALDLYLKHRGILSMVSKVKLSSRDELSIAYTPGVAEPCREIMKDKAKVYDYTSKGNLLAVVTDGSAVLGLGNIGPEAGLPVMEGKCVLFKTFAGIDAFPLCLGTQDVDEIVVTLTRLSPGLGGINLEDISAPRCFEIESRLQDELDIPVFHDDQHGTAVVVLAGLMNAAQLRDSPLGDLKVVIAGVGAAGVAIARLLKTYGVANITMVDSKGIVCYERDDMADYKRALAIDESGDLAVAMTGADVFIGVSKPDIVNGTMIRSMSRDPIVFAMSNPDPEVSFKVAKQAGVRLFATGRSDYPNQLNNVLVFPGILRAAMQRRCQVSYKMKIAAAKALAGIVKNPSPDRFIPYALDEGVADAVTNACLFA